MAMGTRKDEHYRFAIPHGIMDLSLIPTLNSPLFVFPLSHQCRRF
jgi:hypothetical protein